MALDVFSADKLAHDTPPPLSDYDWQLLAEGDSWFSITATFRPSSNLLHELDLPRSAVAINCAAPGATLQRMVDRRADGTCERLLRNRRLGYWWKAVLLSAAGNDLIAAAATPPRDANGLPVPPEQRLLRRADEVGSPTQAADWVSETGWTRLAQHLCSEFALFAQWRDQGLSAGRPIFLHTYATPVARPAGASFSSPQGWLYPALLDYGVPETWRQPLTAHMFERLRKLLLSLDADAGSPQSLPGVHVFDSSRVPLVAADPNSRGESGNWVNEIHLNVRGYHELGRAWGAWIGQQLARYP